MPAIFISIFLLYILGNVYIFIRGRQAIRKHPKGVRVLVFSIFIICALSFLLSFGLNNIIAPLRLARLFEEVGKSWLLVTLYMTLFLALMDFLRLVKIRVPFAFYSSLFLTLGLLFYGYYHYDNPNTKELHITINKPFQTQGRPIKVVSISDIHLGYETNKERLANYVERINALKPDLILIAGDLIDHSLTPVKAQRMQDELSRLKAPLGILMAPGNHDYFSNIEEVEQFLALTPITLLRDSVVTLENGIQVIGRDDRRQRDRESLDKLVRQTDPSKPILLIDHQPYDLERTVDAGIDLQFSGHTHHGQVWPLTYLTDYLFELSYGYEKRENTHLYVSSGLSLWGPPYRIGTDSEIVVFYLDNK